MKVLIVGDVMLDRRIEGRMTRISPEAPVPVLVAKQITESPGGAANVATNLATLGPHELQVNVVGAAGPSPLCVGHPHVNYFLATNPKGVLCKTRLTVDGQQVGPRIDEEPAIDLGEEALIPLIERGLEEDVRLVVVSDYAKGTITQTAARRLMELARQRGLVVFVDAKPSRVPWYTGAYLLTPNFTEARQLCADDPHPVLAESYRSEQSTRVDQALYLAPQIATRYGFRDVTITIGSEGVVHGSHAVQQAKHVAQRRPLEVGDPCGAGDTFLASLAASFLAGRPLTDALQRANVAAGLAVRHHGTTAITADDVEEAAYENAGLNAKLFPTMESVATFTERRRRRGDRIVFTNGCFDYLHPGHYHLLKQAAQFGDTLVVGYNRDDSVYRLKGEGRPKVAEGWRAAMLAMCPDVDAVVPFETDDPTELIRRVKPDVLVKGDEYYESHVPGADWVAGRGGELRFVPMIAGYSTTTLTNS